MLAALLAIGPSDLLSVGWWRHQASDEAAGLSLAAVAGLCLAALLGREIYRLQTSSNTILKDATFAAGSAATLAIFIALRETGTWVWSFAAADLLLTVFLGLLFVITLVTERLNGVRVYAYARRFVFIKRSDA